MLQCFSNSELLAFSISDPKTELLLPEDIEAIPLSSVPPRLQYIVWRSQTFRLKRKSVVVQDVEDAQAQISAPTSTATQTQTQIEIQMQAQTKTQTKILVERTYHPRNFRGSRYLRDWHEEMVFDHLAGDYEDQLRYCSD